MAKTTAPILSFGAGGQLARTQVYASWKGIPYARRYVIPSNPRTTRQMVTRNIFRLLQSLWLVMPQTGKDPYIAFVTGKPLTPNNKFTSSNVKGVDTSAPPTDLSFFIGSPGARGGLPPLAAVVTPGSGQLSVAISAPALPPDWTINMAAGVCIEDQDPQMEWAGTVQAQTDSSSPYTLVFTGLTATQLYWVSAWLVWNRPDGSLAYSTSLTVSGTPT
jgi:hypothetical protein